MVWGINVIKQSDKPRWGVFTTSCIAGLIGITIAIVQFILEMKG